MFGKRKRKLRRVLIVEDEPLVAFDNEHFLGDAGFEVVATVDRADDALAAIARGGLDLVLADVRLSDGTGIEVAHAARQSGLPVLFVAGDCPPDAQALGIGWLAKPYGQRDLLAALDAIEATVSGGAPKRLPGGLRLF